MTTTGEPNTYPQNQPLLYTQQQQPVQYVQEVTVTFQVPAYQVSSKEGEIGEFGCGTSEFGLRMDFKTRPYRDLPFLLAWIAALIVWVIMLIAFSAKAAQVSSSNASSNNSTYSYSSTNDVTSQSLNTLLGKIVAVFMTITALGILFGYAWLALMFRFAKQILKFVIGLKLLILATMTVVFFIWSMVDSTVLGAAVSWLIVFCIVALYYWCVRNRLKLAAAMLRLGSKIVQMNQATILLQFLTSIALFVWWLLWVTVFCLYYYAYASTIQGGVVLLMILMNYWTIDVLANIAHVTTCGVAAVWWFNKDRMVNPTWNSYRYATTKGLGSICFGSLLVSIVQLIRAMVKANASRTSVCGCICLLIARFLEWLIRYFTAYTFVQVAIYGTGFWDSAKNTYQLFSTKGIDAIINDNLSRLVLVTGALVGGIICGLVGGLMAYALFLSYSYDTAVAVAIIFAFIGLFIGYFFTLEFMYAVDSAIKAIFVCWAEDPEALKRNHPVCFQLMSKAWAKVQGTYAGEVDENHELD